MRRLPSVLGVLGVTALLVTACGGSSGGKTSTTTGHPIVLGGPPECPQRPYCEPGLANTYGIKIASFKKLDVGGPLTKKAIKDGTVDVGLVFTSDPSLDSQGLVVLTDDKHLQASDNVVPVVAKALASAPASTALDAVDAKLTQNALVQMNAAVQLQHAKVGDVASGFLSASGLDQGALCGGKSGNGDVTVGAFNFSESELLAEIYAEALHVCGYSTKTRALGSREVVYPALKKGDLDVVPEYAATLTAFIGGTASGKIADTMTALRGALPAQLKALDPAPATDTNAFAVTKTFAQEHSLTTMSDLGAYTQGS